MGAASTDCRPRWRWRRNWLAYIPLAPYLIWLMTYHRSPTVFTAANPGIATGGTVGESKAAALAGVARAGGPVAEYCLLAPNADCDARLRTAMQWMDEAGLTFPVIVKPDAGDHGWGVALICAARDMGRYLDCVQAAVIVQRFIPGIEAGIFYCRHPGTERGRIVSLSESIRPLAAHAGRRCEGLPSIVVSGFRGRDAEYRDARHLITPRLEHAVDALCRAVPGFFFGRFDVRAASAEALRRGEFTIIELNGVLAEATHIYDPATGFAEACATLFRQWRLAFEIGANNRARGTRPAPMRELVKLIAIKLWSEVTASRLRGLARKSRDTLLQNEGGARAS
jgi:hypothetical protein